MGSAEQLAKAEAVLAPMAVLVEPVAAVLIPPIPLSMEVLLSLWRFKLRPLVFLEV